MSAQQTLLIDAEQNLLIEHAWQCSVKLKANYSHLHTDYRHTDKHLRLVMGIVALYCTQQSQAPNIGRCAPGI